MADTTSSGPSRSFRERMASLSLADLGTSAVEVIEATASGLPLATDAIRALVREYTAGRVSDAQMAAWAMAVRWRSLQPEVAVALAAAMADSGSRASWAPLEFVCDKHSSGGVGDKLSLIVAPLLAAAGAHVPMLSGRGLGHTGGTLDKLEAIPGFRVDLTSSEQWQALGDARCFIAAASQDLAPADRKLYALRDQTATVASIPLIAASIMAKKIAAGVESLVLDVKYGRGAFMPDRESARQLAQAMVAIGSREGVATAAQLCPMDVPTGLAVGNAIEVHEAIDVLSGAGPHDVRELSLTLAAKAAELSGLDATRDELAARLKDGSALAHFVRMVDLQGGDLASLPVSRPRLVWTASTRGYLDVDALGIGRAAWRAGAGRTSPLDDVDPAAGILLRVTPGSAVRPGDEIAEVHASTDRCPAARLDAVLADLQAACRIVDDPAMAPGPAVEPSEWVTA